MLTAGSDTDGRHGAEPGRRWRAVAAVIVAAALIGGLALRVFAPSPLWLDEALTVNIARLGFADMVTALRHDGHPALYYLLLGWWMDLFGDGDTAVRALSGLCSLATVPVVWLIGRRYVPPTAAVAATIALSSPFLLRYGTEARMYALVVLLVAAGWLAVREALDRATTRRLAAVAAIAAALVHTNYWAFWVVGAAIVVVGWLCHTATGEERARARRVLVAILGGAATIVVWLGVLLDQARHTGTPWASRARPAEVVVETVHAIGGSDRFEGVLLGIVMVVLVLVGTTAVERATDGLTLDLHARRATAPAAMLVLTLGIGTSVALVTASAFEARYAAVVIPFVLVLAARGLAVLPVAGTTLGLGVVVVLGLAVGVDEARRDRTQGEEVAAAIDAGAGPDDVVVMCPDQLGPATTRSLVHAGDRLAYPDGDGTLVDWADYVDRIDAADPAALASRADELAGDADVWLVAAYTYKGFEGRCEALFDTLVTTRSPVAVVAARPVFEPMTLIRFEARR